MTSTLKDGDRLSLVRSYRDKALESLNDAKDLLESKPRLTARMSYEAAYHFTAALLVSDGIPVSGKHRGVNSELYTNFVDKDLFPRDTAAFLGQLQKDRDIDQYDPVQKVTPQAAQEDLKKAEIFCEAMQKLLDKQIERLEQNPEAHKLEEDVRNLHLIEGDAKIYTSPAKLMNYRGVILHVDQENGYSVQHTGKVTLFVHKNEDLERIPEKAENLQINYKSDRKAEVKPLQNKKEKWDKELSRIAAQELVGAVEKMMERKHERGQEREENSELERDIARSPKKQPHLAEEVAEEAGIDVEKPRCEAPNMAEVQAAESKASVVQGLDKSADGNSIIEGQDIGYAEEGYVAAATQVKYEAQQARTADGEAKNQSFSPQVGQRVSFQAHGSETKLTGNVIATDDKTISLQCGEKVLHTVRGKGTFSETPPLAQDQTKDYAKSQAQKLMGDKGNVFFAQKKGTYNGEIIGKTPTYAIQKVNGETAILHRLKDLEAKNKDGHGLVQEGENVSIVKDGIGVTIEPWNKEREEKEKVRDRQKSRGSQSR